MQADTDFGFLTEIADRTGNDWWVEGIDAGGRRPRRRAGGGASLGFGDDPTLVAFTVRASALHPAEPVVHGWWPTDQAAGQRAGRAATSTGTVRRWSDPFIAGQRIWRAGRRTVTATEVPLDQTEAEVLADRLVGRWTAGAVTAKGTSRQVEPAVVPGVDRRDHRRRPGVRHLPRHRGRARLRHARVRHPVHRRRPPAVLPGRRAVRASEPSSFRREGSSSASSPRSATRNGSPGEVKVAYKAAGDQVESELGPGRHLRRRAAARRDVHPGDQRRGDRRLRGR